MPAGGKGEPLLSEYFHFVSEYMDSPIREVSEDSSCKDSKKKDLSLETSEAVYRDLAAIQGQGGHFPSRTRG